MGKYLILSYINQYAHFSLTLKTVPSGVYIIQVKPNAYSNSFEESPYGWILKHREVSFATDNPQEKWEKM